MILDSGICSIFTATDTAQSGKMPVKTYSLKYQSWYGELSFETSPAYPTDGRKERQTDARIRVLQNRTIKQDDIVLLEQAATYEARTTRPYRITRAYHGMDEENATLITDLTLEVVTP